MTACPLCSPSPHITILWADDFCRVVLLHDTDYPAYCRVELLAHVKEMSDLLPMQRARMMKCVFAVETAIHEVIAPDKINLASLGNKTPHLHWHVIPRFEHDKHFPNSHWADEMREGAPLLLNEVTQVALQMRIKFHIDCALNND